MSTISDEARHLAVVDDGHEVLWQYQMDLGSVLHRGRYRAPPIGRYPTPVGRFKLSPAPGWTQESQ